MVNDHWPDCGAARELIFLKRGFGVEVKKFTCGHKVISVYDEWEQEALTDTSFPVMVGKDKMVLLNPVADIAQALMKDNWFETVVFSAVYLEFFCSKLLREKGGVNHNKIQKMRIYALNKKLRDSGLIGNDTYSKIDRVREVRNGVVHDPKVMQALDKVVAFEVTNLTFESLKDLEPYYRVTMDDLRRSWQI